MNDEKGYIKLYRKMFKNNVVWDTEEPFCKRAAWIDLLGMARYEKTQKEVLINSKIIVVGYGQIVASNRFLMRRWNWGTTAVRTFLKVLEKCQMVNLQPTRGATLITICNYASYNDLESTPNTHPTHPKVLKSKKTQKTNTRTNTHPTHQKHNVTEIKSISYEDEKINTTRTQHANQHAPNTHPTRTQHETNKVNKVNKGKNNNNAHVREDSLLLFPQKIDNFVSAVFADDPFKKSCAKKSFPNDLEVVAVGKVSTALSTFRNFQAENYPETEKTLQDWKIHFQNWLEKSGKKHIDANGSQEKPRPSRHKNPSECYDYSEAAAERARNRGFDVYT